MTLRQFKSICLLVFIIKLAHLQQVVPQKNLAVNEEAPSSQHRIVGGTNAALTEHPYQGLLYIGVTAVCGCSLLDSQWVVTAAHCTINYEASNIYVRFGFTNQDNPEASAVLFAVRAVVNHAGYNSITLENDISLLKLNSIVETSSAISPILLPQQGEEAPVGENCTISGWGNLNENDVLSPSTLQKATVPILSNTQCYSWFSFQVTVYDVQLCAGYALGGVDTCQGDSGGPLACMGPSGYVLQGITSFGVGCARPFRPGVYTRVAEYVDWIETSKVLNSSQCKLNYALNVTSALFLMSLLWNFV